jgi:hypothetical protein
MPGRDERWGVGGQIEAPPPPVIEERPGYAGA